MESILRSVRLIMLIVPAITSDTTNRIIIVVYVEDSITEAVLDTGAPYPIIPPKVAKQAGLDRVEPLERKTMLVRGMRLSCCTFKL
jgi:predicted aspartyl protease